MTGTMPAAVYQGQRTVTLEQLPIPEPGPGEVVLEISHCGICGSDLHLMMEDMGQPGSTGGHEYSGVITAVGPGVEGWAVGERVVGGPDVGCGTCSLCVAGRANLCLHKGQAGVGSYQGAFAAYKKLDAGSLFRIPSQLDLRTAALTEPTAVALRGVRRSGLRTGERALVTGAGPIGLLSIAVLRAFGVDDVTVTEPAPKRRQRALDVGARVAIEPGDLPATPGHPGQLVDQPFHGAIECSGRADAMEAALGQLAPAGTLVLSGTGLKRPKFDSNRIILNELSVTGTVEYTHDDYAQAIGLLASGRLPVAALIEPNDVPLSRIQQAMEQLVAGDLPGKVMVVPRA
jgi:(R,R)-butanediol dehydrogenase/meso-butanediol dehydrogenase/diacetyl reductase